MHTHSEPRACKVRCFKSLQGRTPEANKNKLIPLLHVNPSDCKSTATLEEQASHGGSMTGRTLCQARRGLWKLNSAEILQTLGRLASCRCLI